MNKLTTLCNAPTKPAHLWRSGERRTLTCVAPLSSLRRGQLWRAGFAVGSAALPSLGGQLGSIGTARRLSSFSNRRSGSTFYRDTVGSGTVVTELIGGHQTAQEKTGERWPARRGKVCRRFPANHNFRLIAGYWTRYPRI